MLPRLCHAGRRRIGQKAVRRKVCSLRGTRKKTAFVNILKLSA